MLNSWQNVADAAAESTSASTALVLGLGAVVLGTMLHAAMFVYSELTIKQAHIHLLSSACMGLIETSMLRHVEPAARHPRPALSARAEPCARGKPAAAAALLRAAAARQRRAYAQAFFNMLEKVEKRRLIAVMKSAQLVLVFAFSVTFFCQFQATQCFSMEQGRRRRRRRRRPARVCPLPPRGERRRTASPGVSWAPCPHKAQCS